MKGKCIICREDIEFLGIRCSGRTCEKHSKDPNYQKNYQRKYREKDGVKDAFLRMIATVRTEKWRPEKIYNWSYL